MNSWMPTREQPLGDAEDAQRQDDEPTALLAAGNLLQARHVHLLVSHPSHPQNTHLLFFSHYESSSCLVFKTHIQITELGQTKAEMIPINLTCPVTTTAGTVVYVLPDCFL